MDKHAKIKQEAQKAMQDAIKQEAVRQQQEQAKKRTHTPRS